MKITATLLLFIFSISAGKAQTSNSVSGVYPAVQTSQHRESMPYMTDHFYKDSIGLSNGSGLQIGMKGYAVKNNITSDLKFNWHHYVAVLFSQEINSRVSGEIKNSDNPQQPDNKMDYYRGKSLLFK